MRHATPPTTSVLPGETDTGTPPGDDTARSDTPQGAAVTAALRSGDLPSPERAGWLVAAAALAALVAVVIGLVYGGGAGRAVDPGLPDAGAVTGWGLPLTQVAARLAAALVIGNLLAAVFWSPSRDAGPDVVRFHRRVAGTAAAVWAVAAIAVWLFTLSDLRGLPVSGILTSEALDSLGLRTSAGQAGLVTLVAASAATALCRRYPAAALLVALLGVLPPAFVESAVSTADHRSAIAAQALLVLAATVCAGALAALLLRAARDRAAPTSPPAEGTATGDTGAGRVATSGTPVTLVTAARRYGRLAPACLLVAGAAVVLSASLVLGPTDTGLDSTYGRLIAGLLAALGVAAAIGRWRSTQTVPALGRGLPGPFVRFAALELAVLGAFTGLSVALARTPSPLESGVGIHHESPGVQMLGYDLPPSVSFAQLASDWRPDVLYLVLCAVLVAGYLWLEARAHRAGVTWSARRSGAWLAGVAAIALATSSGVGRYAPVFFSVTIVQHVLLAVVAPLLLSRGAPLTLALRALPRTNRTGGEPVGPRDWVLAAVRSRPARVVTAPGTVVTLWVAGLAGVYFTGVFEATRWSYAIDLAVQAYLLGSGSLVFWWLTGTDPRPAGRRADGTRIWIAIAAAVAAITAGLLLTTVVGVVAADWWIGLLRVLPLPWPWGSATAADDQAVGGTLLAAVPAAVFLVIAADRLAAGVATGKKARPQLAGENRDRSRDSRPV